MQQTTHTQKANPIKKTRNKILLVARCITISLTTNITLITNVIQDTNTIPFIIVPLSFIVQIKNHLRLGFLR